MISFLRSDKNINEFIERPSAETKEKSLEFISKINNGINNLEFYYWAITNKNNTEMIGSICLWNFSKNKKTAEIGYDLSPDFQGKGIMNESLISVLNFGFSKLNLNSILAYTHKLNENSKKLLLKNGFRLLKNNTIESNTNTLVYEIKKPV